MISGLCSLCLLLALFQLPGQSPPWTPNPTAPGSPPVEPAHRFPIDQPQQAPQRRNQSIDMVRVKHDADELAQLAGQIPLSVEQANKGLLSKDLNERLKRIEKLSKQLRRELYP